jgi:hypothetical protein
VIPPPLRETMPFARQDFAATGIKGKLERSRAAAI